MSTAMPLAPILDTAAAEPLRAALLAQLTAGSPLLLDGGAVDQVGLACLQVLAGARVSAGNAGTRFAISGGSEPFRRAIALTRFDALLAPVG